LKEFFPCQPSSKRPSKSALFDPIVACTVRPPVIKKMSRPDEYGPLKYIWDEQPLGSLVSSPPLPAKPTTLSFKQIRYLLKTRFLRLASSTSKGFVSMFGVFKPSGNLRPIANPELNQRSSWIHKLYLPAPLELLTCIFSATVAIPLDFCSWFCQIPVCSSMASYFTVVTRGLTFVLNCLPQGWKASPFLANQITRILLGKLQGTCPSWIDNILLTARSPLPIPNIFQRPNLIWPCQELLSKWAYFKARCSAAGAKFKEWPTKMFTDFIFVGFHVCLTTKRWQLDPAWTAKVFPRLHSIISSRWALPLRSWWYLGGCVFWATRVLSLPIAELMDFRMWMSDMAVLMEKGKVSWTTPVKLPPMVKVNLLPYVAVIHANPWQLWWVPPHSLVLYSDASTTGGAFLSTKALAIFSWLQKFPSAQIFALESLAIHMAILHHAPLYPGTKLVFFSDNLPAVQAYSHSASDDPFVNRLIALSNRLLSATMCKLQLQHVPSEKNPTDEFSRRELPWGSFHLTISPVLSSSLLSLLEPCAQPSLSCTGSAVQTHGELSLTPMGLLSQQGPPLVYDGLGASQSSYFEF